MKKLTRVLVATTATLAIAVGGAATAYAAHYQDRALPGSSLAGVQVSGQTRAELATSLRQRVADTKITVATPSGRTTASLADLGYKVDVDATVARVFDENSQLSSYVKALTTDRSVGVVSTFDPQVMDSYVAELASTDGTPAANAKVIRAEGASAFTVTPAVAGKTIDPASFQDVVKKAATDLVAATANAKIIDLPAAVSTESAQAIADQANAIVTAPVTITAEGKTFTATEQEKAAWVTVGEKDGAPTAPTVDAAKIGEWVTKQAGSVTVKPVKGVRNVNSQGAVLSVVTKAKDGVDVGNAQQVAEALAAKLTAGQGAQEAFTTTVVQATWTERKIADGAQNLAYQAADGEKWIDVNLANKTMTAYVGAAPAFGPISVVDGGSETPTVTGTYRVYLKYAVQTMRGANADGTNYEAPDVPWVTYFYRGYALHGAPWRSSFGYSGSHGCVNLPVSVAKQVYDFAPLGTPVVVHR